MPKLWIRRVAAQANFYAICPKKMYSSIHTPLDLQLTMPKLWIRRVAAQANFYAICPKKMYSRFGSASFFQEGNVVFSLYSGSQLRDHSLLRVISGYQQPLATNTMR
ncbi:hypothetical protein GE061_018996 [Apolygus lucorum]|uniref:Uncharacterized protein n=1 Tax=Apolygus lucorum TaxID=248454 RepID=A0A8S9X799_APOLU|nr:hypothetical protein GE061_018996 [Apolygus lucorum]